MIKLYVDAIGGGFMKDVEKVQMSESFILAIVLALGGGFRDSYSYLSRGGVFANAQTGNLVLMSQGLFRGDFVHIFKYLLPIMAFILGIYLTEIIRKVFRDLRIIHWRQLVLIFEVVLLVIVGFMPSSMNYFANVIISFSCAIQVQSFKSFHGSKMATTMCTGNLRVAAELLSDYSFTKNRKSFNTSRYYIFIIFIFCIGAGMGSILSEKFGIYSIWADAVVIFIGFLFMFLENSPFTELRVLVYEKLKDIFK